MKLGLERDAWRGMAWHGDDVLYAGERGRNIASEVQ